uniref:Uncharacterized protein n=1 Tax=Magallana gigas TaxID=29159 RepID=K1RXJ2_MAGGI
MLFKLILIHRNLDEAVDMGDGERSTRSAKYELPIYWENEIHNWIYTPHCTCFRAAFTSAN